MKKCEKLENCDFFNDRLEHMPLIADELKEQFCFKDKDHCARYIISEAIGKDEMPENLFPNQPRRANFILQNFKKNKN